MRVRGAKVSTCYYALNASLLPEQTEETSPTLCRTYHHIFAIRIGPVRARRPLLRAQQGACFAQLMPADLKDHSPLWSSAPLLCSSLREAISHFYFFHDVGVLVQA